MSVFGIVILTSPAVPFDPIIVKDTVVILGWFDVIVASDICELVTFPASKRSTIAPLAVVAGTAVAEGVGVGVVVEVGVAVGKVVGVGVGDGDGVGEPKA